jgi:hypothetical protein
MAEEKKQNIFSRGLSWVFQGNYRVKIFFLLLSCFLWLLIKLSKPGYVADFDMPLQFSNLPQNKLLVNNPATQAKLTLKGDGFTLLRYTLTSFKPASVNLSQLKATKTSHYYWLPRANASFFKAQLTDETEIVRFRPDSIIFELKPLSSKKVPVTAPIKISPNLGVELYKPALLNPDSILITGPAEALEAIDSLQTETWLLKNETAESLRKKLRLKIPKEDKIKSSHQEVTVSVVLSRITEGVAQVPISLLNVPDAMQIEIYPKKVQVRYRLALRDFEKIDEDDFTVAANLHQLSNNPNQRFLTLTARDLPPYIKSVALDPKRVEFIATSK